VLLTAGCGAKLLHVTPPTPRNDVVPICNTLNDRLPNLLEKLQSRGSTPRSPLVHVWGSKHPVVLRCGVPTPPRFSEESAQTTQVNDVTWFQQVESDRVVWTAIRKRANVELIVPTYYEGQGAFLVDVGDAIAATIP
jgi:hypothetical protein